VKEGDWWKGNDRDRDRDRDSDRDRDREIGCKRITK
jgi:hypothetical protein